MRWRCHSAVTRWHGLGFGVPLGNSARGGPPIADPHCEVRCVSGSADPGQDGNVGRGSNTCSAPSVPSSFVTSTRGSSNNLQATGLACSEHCFSNYHHETFDNDCIESAVAGSLPCLPSEILRIVPRPTTGHDSVRGSEWRGPYCTSAGRFAWPGPRVYASASPEA